MQPRAPEAARHPRGGRGALAGAPPHQAGPHMACGPHAPGQAPPPQQLQQLCQPMASDPAVETALDSAFWSNDACRMAYLKVLPCFIRAPHDWRECPFYHPGERGRRRSFEGHVYRSDMCPAVRQGGQCPRGDACTYAHNVFEARLHPDLYKVKMCADGDACKRKICFFAVRPGWVGARA
ncbi:MAG: hypothetical protein J3K34DRAFT_233596 [Monoraphidium minutum]|nr:MAG: hypothetical protein J3K34DRAFT_233596 [Monoraphidium minutum]